jgi:signal transduction histidine kinase
MNRKAELLLGAGSGKFHGMPVEKLLKTDIPQNELPCKKALHTSSPCLDVTYQLEVGQGKIPVLSSAAPLFNSQGDLIGSVEIMRDISTLKALEQEKEDFVSMLTHDLKTPLTAVMGSIDLIREERLGKINAEQKDYLESALESCSEVVEMINTLLDLYRFEANKMVMTFAQEDTEALIQRAMAGFRSLAERSRIKLNAHFPERLPAIRVDRGKFVRLISNLLSNAFKFTPDRGEIDLTAELTDVASIAVSIPKLNYPDAKLPDKGKFLKIQLKDTGIGIPPETLGTIFDKFVQGGTRARLKNKGTGLGLTFCRKVMDAHGGYIWAESVPDKGSTFIVLFPLQKDK